MSFMIFWGVLPEIRIFGELIPYVTCVSAILVDEVIADRFPSTACKHEGADLCQ
jgi:hypothetical protein